jgi:hypothetical protein
MRHKTKRKGMDVREVVLEFCYRKNNFFVSSTTPTFPLRRRQLQGSMIPLKSNLGLLLRLWARLYVDSRTSASLRKKRPRGRNVKGRMARREMQHQPTKQNSSPLVTPKSRNSKRPNPLVEDGSWSFQPLKLEKWNWKILLRLVRPEKMRKHW